MNQTNLESSFVKVHNQLTTATLPAAIAKLGTIELEVAYIRYIQRIQIKGNTIIQPTTPPITISQIVIQILSRNAGMFPPTTEIAEKMADELLKNILELTLVVKWQNVQKEKPIFDTFARDTKSIELQGLECYLSKNKDHWWTANIPEHTKILVITPFSETAQKQCMRLDKIWQMSLWQKNLQFSFIKFPLSFGVQSEQIQQEMIEKWGSSIGLLRDIEKQMDAIDYDICMVGAGIHSIPLVAHAKRKGKKGIHTGGATQIYFGIRGDRWDNMQEFRKMYNNYWVRPANNEIPNNYKQIEKGCYW